MKWNNVSLGKCFFKPLLLLCVVFNAPYVQSADVPPAVEPDIVFVRVPAAAEARYGDGNMIVRLSHAGNTVKAEVLTPGFLSACDPDISFDGLSILFAGKQKTGDAWQIWQMDADGQNKRQITHGTRDAVSPLYAGSLFHFTRGSVYEPYVAANGRILYSSSNPDNSFDVFAVNLDGTDLMGFLARPHIPGDKTMVRADRDSRVYFIQSSPEKWPGGGALAYVSQRRPYRSHKQLSPADKGRFHSPSPLPGGGLLASFRRLEKDALYGLYAIDPGTGKLLHPYHTSKDYHIIDARVLAPRPVVKGRSSFVDHYRRTGVLYCISVYISQDPRVKDLPRGSVTQVRVSEKGKGLLGIAPVEPDGSFHIEVPARTPLTFDLLDKEGKTVSSQQSGAWVMPRESRGCIGCHEDPELAPPNRLAEAIVKPAVKLPGGAK
jgi:hypothetical protein